jgi:O-antigen/teichoic acid export membrane protein
MYNYSKNYIKIYFWKIISIVSGFLSLLIVVPHLSNDKELYGIYTFCISFTLYLSYADIGFLSAGQKYASEAFAKGNRKDEVDILGFTGAILLLMIAPFSIAMIYISYHPDVILNNLSVEAGNIASKIFLILGIVLPFQIIIQRLVQSILIIRIKDYISLRIDVLFNLIKIGSVFYFFSNDNYLIVEYYLFITLMMILSSIIILGIIQKSESYNFLNLLKAIRFSKKQYDITKKLAYSSFFLTIGWLVYYELDLIFIGKWLGPKEVAIYAIGFTFLNFLRTLWNSVFGPFAQRFNHFVGLDAKDELKSLLRNIIDYTFPLSVITTLILVLSSELITVFWVGNEYLASVNIMQALIVGTVFLFISSPASYYFNAATRYSYIYLFAIVLPLVFLISNLILTPTFGLFGIAVSKSLAMLVCFIISVIGLFEVFNPLRLIKKWIFNLVILCSFLIYVFPVVLENIFINQVKSSKNLLILIFISGSIIIISYILILLTKQEQRRDLRIVWLKLIKKIVWK